ncbi:hypothetical protein SAMN05444156_0784 [Verrucomicrobium sp. GAS474]|uniref:zinc-binding metallopeptidase family protein n=1 Tax=Verrucomicrobium sp. GAS474 TaxID=1882831 RepID=UPI00087C6A42|nr:putative zinc-binding metallopeptidase [Verrucomicrobium sp. GAS474]SDT92401.1 hypothetical protein SAMN05444156_0784 [Verrucomicrobium sp. GAS474]
MKTYHCVCGQLVFFENVRCVSCQRELGFLPDLLCQSPIEAAPGQGPGTRPNLFVATAPAAKGRLYRKCQNYSREVACNWMIPEEEGAEPFCTSCRLDETIPDLSTEQNRTLWRLIEAAKRRLVYTLIKLDLPLLNRIDDPRQGLSFRFLADAPGMPVLTGHEDGIITLNIAEADDGERERRRLSMQEPYRTLLGHFRHEIGHYYWDRLVAGTKYLKPFRALFGDERADYNQALQNYYATGTLPNWQESYISAYATAHPWEDWAESWAHYLHIQDTLEVAMNYGLADKRMALETPGAPPSDDRAASKSFEEKIAAWSELSIALNSINRSMGLKDIYPFVLSTQVVEKLRFVSEVIAGRSVEIAVARTETPAPIPAGPSASPSVVAGV